VRELVGGEHVAQLLAVDARRRGGAVLQRARGQADGAGLARLDHGHRRRLRAAFALLEAVLDDAARGQQALVAVQVVDVDEHVVPAVLRRDEAVSLDAIERDDLTPAHHNHPGSPKIST